MEEHDNEKKPFSLMEYFLGFIENHLERRINWQYQTKRFFVNHTSLIRTEECDFCIERFRHCV